MIAHIEAYKLDYVNHTLRKYDSVPVFGDLKSGIPAEVLTPTPTGQLGY